MGFPDHGNGNVPDEDDAFQQVFAVCGQAADFVADLFGGLPVGSQDAGVEPFFPEDVAIGLYLRAAGFKAVRIDKNAKNIAGLARQANGGQYDKEQDFLHRR